MDRRLVVARFVAGSAFVLLFPVLGLTFVATGFLALAIVDAAVLAGATAYAVYLGVYAVKR